MAERQIHVIKARRKMPKPFLNVGVYCRVSTPSQEQLHSLAAQVSHFVRKYHDLYNYRLYDVYIDVVSGAKTLARSRVSANAGGLPGRAHRCNSHKEYQQIREEYQRNFEMPA